MGGPIIDDLMAMIERMYPFCRSITGNGVRATLDVVGERLPLQVHEVPSGTTVLDWTVPDEWNIADVFVADLDGRRVVDFRESNLHVLNYSVPVDAIVSRAELDEHLHSLPDQPDRIPYRTSYYERNWGFCLTQQCRDSLRDERYRVRIDSSLEPGHLTYGEVVVPGRTTDEILISSHVCHPSLCDDNLSGIAVAATLARRLLDGPELRHTVRFLFAPGTIGAITWLSRNPDATSLIRHGLTLTCLGDGQPLTFKQTESASALIDRAAAHILRHHDPADRVIPFSPYGYDERQYSSPGYRLAVGSLMRGHHGMFPEYHTSADNLSFIRGDQLVDALDVLSRIVEVVDRDRCLINTEPFGEPQLGRRGLYRSIGGRSLPDGQMAMLWLLNQSDGEHSLLDVAERAGVPFATVDTVAVMLEDSGLLRPAS